MLPDHDGHTHHRCSPCCLPAWLPACPQGPPNLSIQEAAAICQQLKEKLEAQQQKAEERRKKAEESLERARLKAAAATAAPTPSEL